MEQAISLPTKWSQGTLIAFRFFFVYAVLYVLPFPLQLIPDGSTLSKALREFYFHGYGWIARNFMGLELSAQIPTAVGK